MKELFTSPLLINNTSSEFYPEFEEEELSSSNPDQTPSDQEFPEKLDEGYDDPIPSYYFSRSFIIFTDIYRKCITEVRRVKQHLKFEEKYFTLAKYKKLIHPEHKSRVLNFGRAMRKLLRTHRRFKGLAEKIAYSLYFPIQTAEGKYMWVQQISIAHQVDNRKLVLVEKNTYLLMGDFIRNLYEAGAQITNENGHRITALENVLRKEASPYIKHPFTEREMDVLQLLINTQRTSNDIANLLGISKETVDKHRKNIIKKGKEICPLLRSTEEIAQYFHQQHLI